MASQTAPATTVAKPVRATNYAGIIASVKAAYPALNLSWLSNGTWLARHSLATNLTAATAVQHFTGASGTARLAIAQALVAGQPLPAGTIRSKAVKVATLLVVATNGNAAVVAQCATALAKTP